jgi:hypothetical protein
MPNNAWRKKSVVGRLVRVKFPATIADYPFESILAVWGTFSAINTAFGPSSVAVNDLPVVLQASWGILMGLSALTIFYGLFRHLYDVVAAGLYLLAIILVAYASAVIGYSGWARGGLTGGLVFSIGAICYVRGWWLKTRDRIAQEEATRTEGQ